MTPYRHVPPPVGGEPPMAERFRRWCFGVAPEAVVAVWAIAGLAAGSFRIPKPGRYARGSVELIGMDALVFGGFLLLAALLAHRRIFWSGDAPETEVRFWPRVDQALFSVLLVPVGYGVWRILENFFA